MNTRHAERRNMKHPGFAALLVLLAMAALAALLMSSSVFVVRNIQVTGVTSVSTQDVIVQSGLRQGESIFLIDQGKIRDNINAHKLLYFESIDVKFPNTVILQVREREACAQIAYLGFMYAIDETGRVLYKSGDLNRETELPVIEGVSIVSIAVGEELNLVDKTQFACAQKMIDALEEANMLRLVHELNVSDPENLYIMTREDTKVELGTTDSLSIKLAIAQAILRDQADRPLQGAKIDVSSGTDGYFIPSDL